MSSDAISTRRNPAPAPWPWIVAIAAVVAVVWAPTLSWMVGRWAEPGGYWLHGFAVPPAAAWLAWRRRREAQWGSGGGAAPGIALVAVGSLLQAAAAIVEFHFASAVALLLVLAGLVLACGGPRALRASREALLLLLLMMPLPMQIVAAANLELKLAASAAAVWTAQHLGVVVVQDGAVLALPGGQELVVGTVCSGLRFLVSLAALGAFVAMASALPLPGKTALFGAALAVAFAANVLRIVLLVVVAAHWGATTASEGSVVHDASGAGLFAVALAALLGVESLLRRGCARRPSAAERSA